MKKLKEKNKGKKKENLEQKQNKSDPKNRVQAY